MLASVRSSAVPDAELGVKYECAAADCCSEDVPVKVICDPELLTWLALPRVVLDHLVDELGCLGLAHE